MTDRRRNTFVLLIVLGLVILSLLVIVGIPGVVKAKKTRLGLDLKGGVELIYQARPTAQSKVDAESLERAIDIMRKRVDQLGVAQPEIQRTGADEIDVALPDVSNAARAQAEVGKTAQLYFYDWEPNVIGPDGKPAPTESTVTGGEQAASSASGLPEYQAVLRAAKRPAIIRKSDTTLSPGCTPEQKEGCIYGTWYLLDTKHEKVLRGPEETEANLYSEGFKAPTGATGEGGARQPRHGARAGAPGRKRRRQGHAGLAEQLVRAQRRPGAGRLGHHEPAGELGKRIGPAGRELRLHLARQERVPAGHQGNRRSAARKRSCRA